MKDGVPALRVLAALVVGAIGHPAAAFAQVELDWRAPSSCMSEQQARDSVVLRIGRDPFVEHGGQLRIVVSAGEGSLLRFELSDRNGQPIGQRAIESEADCRAIDREIAVVLSLLVEVGESEIELVIPVPPPIEPPPRRRPRETPAPSSWMLVLGARITGAAAVVADASIGADVFAGIAVSGYEVRIEAFGARGDSIASTPSISSLAFGAALRGCADVLVQNPVSVAPCAFLAAGSIRAEGKNLASVREAEAPFVAAGAGVRLEIALAAFASFEVELDAIVPLARAMFVYDGGRGLAFEPWPVAPALASGLRLLWGS
jgi:hypothetical protein